MSGLTHTSALTKPLQEAGVSEEASNYAVNALDQFHDFPTQITGLPDESKGKSIVYDLNQQQSITSNQLIFPTAATRWDCHIAFIPALATNSSYVSAPTTNGVPSAFFGFDPTDPLYNIYNTNTGTPQSEDGWNPRGILVVCKVLSQSATFSTSEMSTDPLGNPPLYEIFVVEQLLDNSRARLISGGYEIHNVTEEFYRSGTVTDYSVDDPPTRGSAAVSNGSLFTLSNSIHIAAPPSNLTNATQINGVTREAAEGSYVNFKIQDAEGFDASYPEVGEVVYDSDEVYTSIPNCTTAFVSGGPGYVYPLAYGTDTLNLRRVLNFQQCGSYYTGLSQQTVLNVQLKCQVEVFPVPGSPEMALASYSPQHDPRALEFVHRVQQALPVAHRVADNGLGDMFRSVLKVANKVSSGLSMIPGPIGAIASAVNMGTAAADELWEDEKPQQQQRKVRPPRQRTAPAREPTRRQRGKARRRNRQVDNILRKDARQGTRM